VLRGIVPDDIQLVFRLPLAPLRTMRWELGGRSCNPELAGHLLWGRVLTQAMVEVPGCSALVQIHDDDLQNGHAKLGLALVGQEAALFASRDLISQEVTTFVRMVFDDFPLEKLYIESLSDMAATREFLPAPTHLEGRLVEHERRSVGVFVDLELAALYRRDVQGRD